MTIWDTIYKNYQKGGVAWATLSEKMHPLFKDFLEKSNFEHKAVLDIGCGTGRYLKILQAAAFQTDGIDSSETAVEITKNLLADHSNIICAHMFDFKIPVNKYDFIISISAIHHGRKEEIANLINQIYEALLINGKIFITLPDLESSKAWETFKNNEDLGEGTFAPLSGPEQGLPHSFFTKEEVEKLFLRFNNVEMSLDSHGRWIIRADKYLKSN